MATCMQWPWRAVWAGALILAPLAASAGEGFSAGIAVKAQASDAETGLPVYPGAVRRLDKDRDGDSVQLALWGGELGLKVVAVQYTSSAPLARVAGFYRDALGRDGPVLDCDQPPPAGAARRRDDDDRLQCEADDTPRPGRKVYKAGTRHHQRVVQLRQDGDAVQIDVVRIEVRD